MEINIETERLILRPWSMEDVPFILKLNSNLDVIKYLHIPPMETTEQAKKEIQYVLDQYESNGLGRLIMVEKLTGKCMGWSGLKIEDMEMNGYKDFYDVGYRMLPEFWGKGYATESAIASLKFGFEKLGVEKINAAAHIDNLASQRVLTKAGLKYQNTFEIFDFKAYWYEIEKADWEN